MDLSTPKCDFCEKIFSTRCNLLRHIRTVHKVQKRSTNSSYLCLEDQCMSKFTSSSKLREHLKNGHNYKFEETVFEFDNLDEFSEWKNKIEQKEDCNFVKETGGKTISNGEKRSYYSCHRSGKSRRGKSNKMTQDSNKIGFSCTAGITLIERHNSTIKCFLCSTHYGHSKEIGKLYLTESEKRVIASKLLQNISSDNILKDIRDDLVTKDKPRRIHLTTKEDIKNIKRKYNLNGPQRHPNDATSVSLMITEFKNEGSNPVVACKFQGEQGIGLMAALEQDDIFFVIQHPVQVEMLHQFGSRTVCVDSTHGTNRYGFYLVTLLIIDEYEEGFPVAFCLCSREDAIVMRVFFSVVQQNIQVNLEPIVFMSDDAPAFYNAWQAVFGPAKNKLLCAWHVERAIRQKLQATIKDKEVLCQVYKSICLLLEETDQEKFNIMLDCIKDLLQNPNVKEFGAYFLKNYLHRLSEIAACYRVNLGINTNMHLESFHRIFKYNFLKAKSNNRMDLCIFKIVEYIKSKVIERITKIERGKLTNKLRIISARHKSSLTMDFGAVTREDGNYHVKSASSDQKYLLKVSPNTCQCKVRCRECGYCIHEVTCTCEDYTIRHVLCKHSHLLIRKINLLDNYDIPLNAASEEEDPLNENISDTSTLSVMSVTEEINNNAPSPKVNIDTSVKGTNPEAASIHLMIKEDKTSTDACMGLIKTISEKLQSMDPVADKNTIQQIHGMLKNIYNVININKEKTDLDIQKLPHIKEEHIKVKKQRSFYATKKKPGPKRNPLKKAAGKEKQKILDEILSNSEDQTYSASQNATEDTDHNYTNHTQPPLSNKTVKVITRDQSNLLKKVISGNLQDIFSTDLSIHLKHLKTSQTIPDSIIDNDIELIKDLLSKDCFHKLEEIISQKQQNWICGMCPTVTTRKDMIECDSCSTWVHFDCVGIEEVPKGSEWKCSICQTAG